MIFYLKKISYLKILLGSFSAGPCTEGDKSHRRGSFAIFAGFFEQGAFVTLEFETKNEVGFFRENVLRSHG